MSTPRLLSLATRHARPCAGPAERRRPLAAEVFKGQVFPHPPDLLSIFENNGHPHPARGVRPLAWYAEPHGWPERNLVYLEGAEALYVEVAETALAQAGLAAADIGQLVTVSSSGVATPSLGGAGGRPHGLSPGGAAHLRCSVSAAAAAVAGLGAGRAAGASRPAPAGAAGRRGAVDPGRPARPPVQGEHHLHGPVRRRSGRRGDLSASPAPTVEPSRAAASTCGPTAWT